MLDHALLTRPKPFIVGSGRGETERPVRTTAVLVRVFVVLTVVLPVADLTNLEINSLAERLAPAARASERQSMRAGIDPSSTVCRTNLSALPVPQMMEHLVKRVTHRYSSATELAAGVGWAFPACRTFLSLTQRAWFPAAQEFGQPSHSTTLPARFGRDLKIQPSWSASRKGHDSWRVQAHTPLNS